MDKLMFGLSVALIGMLVVFVGLIILIGSIKLISAVSKQRKVKEPAPAAEIPVQAAPVIAQNVAQNAIGSDISTETLIAITTAIFSVWTEDSGFVVRRVRRVNNAPAWNLAGREDQVYSRM